MSVNLSATLRLLTAFKWVSEKFEIFGPGFGCTEQEISKSMPKLDNNTNIIATDKVENERTYVHQMTTKQLKSPIAALYASKLTPINE